MHWQMVSRTEGPVEGKTDLESMTLKQKGVKDTPAEKSLKTSAALGSARFLSLVTQDLIFRHHALWISFTGLYSSNPSHEYSVRCL